MTNYQGKAHEHATKKGKFPHVKWNLQNNMERSITVTEENSSSYSDVRRFVHNFYIYNIPFYTK